MIAGLLAAMVLSLCAADFAVPEVGPVAFRRDRVPLSAMAQDGLSRDLEILARGLAGQTAEERQTAARMLALAMVLDPANARARALLAAYQNGRHKRHADPARIETCHARIWQMIAWLEIPDAGADGNALANCLKDVMVVSDPKHPQAAGLRGTGAKGAWAGWVPGIQAYGGQENPTRRAEDMLSGDGRILLENARVFTLLWKPAENVDSTAWMLGPGLLRMEAQTIHDHHKPAFSIMIDTGDADNPLAPLARSLETLMQAWHNPLPAGLHIRIYSRTIDLTPDSGKLQPISAAAAVLASAAITGREPEAIVIGEIDESGSLSLPPDFWDQIMALGPGKGRRLVLPAAAADWLPSLLALEKPGFFLDYEVLLADGFRDLLDLTAKEPDQEVAAACAKFRELREHAATQEIGNYLANRFVRERLEELARDVPFHFSAELLLVQAGGRKRAQVTRGVLAAELRRALEPMAWIAATDGHDPTDAELKKLGETRQLCQAGIERMERYTEKTDLDLLERTRSLVSTSRIPDRGSRSRGTAAAFLSLRDDLIRLFNELAQELAEETGSAWR
jgi:hypothetical protein